ncbi:unnamed protein product [Meloidogyne enterolobii]|uniref:Uncharacterized protein n=1 Tax=Meloidogyne enterolobii TaxID=390850 RepID=A0ACB0YS08_MELEN
MKVSLFLLVLIQEVAIKESLQSIVFSIGCFISLVTKEIALVPIRIARSSNLGMVNVFSLPLGTILFLAKIRLVFVLWGHVILRYIFTA